MVKNSVVVVGAGLIGRLVAWRLATEGYKITVVDKSSRNSRISAGLTAAAMMAPYTESVCREKLVCDIGLISLKQWPEIISQLESQSGIDIFCEFNGTLVIAHSQDKQDWDGFVMMARSKIGTCGFRLLEKNEISQLEPELPSRFNRACFFENEGVLSNEQLYQSLSIALDQFNVCWIEEFEVMSKSDIDKLGIFDWIVDCRGMGSAISEKLSWPVDHHNLRGVRGEVIRVYAPEVKLKRPIRLIHPRYPLYIAPHGNHQFVVGATEIESESLGGVTVRSALELLSALYTVHSGFAEAEILSLETNLRPAYSNNLPKVRVVDNYISINGLYRHGYLFGPAIIEDVWHYINNRASHISFNHLFEIAELHNQYENFG